MKIKIEILTLGGSVHKLFWRGNGNIKIGCIEKTIEDWKSQFKEIGKKQNYSEEQIEEYGRYIQMISQLQDNLK